MGQQEQREETSQRSTRVQQKQGCKARELSPGAVKQRASGGILAGAEGFPYRLLSPPDLGPRPGCPVSPETLPHRGQHGSGAGGRITPGSRWPGAGRLGDLDLPIPPKGSEVNVTCIRVSLPQKPPLLVRSRTWFTTWEGSREGGRGFRTLFPHLQLQSFPHNQDWLL